MPVDVYARSIYVCVLTCSVKEGGGGSSLQSWPWWYHVLMTVLIHTYTHCRFLCRSIMLSNGHLGFLCKILVFLCRSIMLLHSYLMFLCRSIMLLHSHLGFVRKVNHVIINTLGPATYKHHIHITINSVITIHNAFISRIHPHWHYIHIASINTSTSEWLHRRDIWGHETQYITERTVTGVYLCCQREKLSLSHTHM